MPAKAATTSRPVTLTEARLLELAGTHPSDVARVLARLTAGDLASVLANMTDGDLARVLDRLPGGDLASVLSLLTDTDLARVLARLTAGDLARVLSLLTAVDRARVLAAKNITADVPALDRPYTAILNAITAGGVLEMDDVHSCDSTHCIGGWLTTLTGAAGKALEGRFGFETAAILILRKSRPEAPLPNFYARNEAAMAFIKARAAEEGA